MPVDQRKTESIDLVKMVIITRKPLSFLSWISHGMSITFILKQVNHIRWNQFKGIHIDFEFLMLAFLGNNNKNIIDLSMDFPIQIASDCLCSVGANGNNCDGTGACTCKSGHTGQKCDECTNDGHIFVTGVGCVGEFQLLLKSLVYGWGGGGEGMGRGRMRTKVVSFFIFFQELLNNNKKN